jgi:hypothetical protein
VRKPEHSFADPAGTAIKRWKIPPADPPKLSKGYWDSVVRRLDLLGDDEAWELPFPANQQTSGLRSSIHMAGARAGRRLRVAIRGAYVYVWDAGSPRERKRYRPPLDPIFCEACGKLIKQPRAGQVVHAGVGTKKSDCQKARLYAKRHGSTPREEWAHIQHMKTMGR